MITRKLALALAVTSTGALATGCLERDLKPLRPCTVSGVVRQVQVTNVDKVDLLFMVDNSNSMTEEQTSLATEFPRMVRILASGDRDGNGTEDFPAVKDLQIGVVTSDMGTGGFVVPTCVEPNFGDDGILRTRGNSMDPTCMATYPRFAQFRPAMAGADPDAFARDVSCVARVGIGGCGFEQQLEAVLKAVSPAGYVPPGGGFNMGTVGHADRENAGFVRPDSVLAIIMVTDEEDCSARDPQIFNTMSSTYTGDLNLRCFQYSSAALHPITRYVDGLRAQRLEFPDRLVFAAITGVPTDLVSDPDAIDYARILDDPRMQERIDTMAMTPRLVPSCNVPGRGIAFPPRRIVQVAQQFGENGVVQSICQENFGPALDAIIEKIANQLRGACLPRALNPDSTGEVGCDVVEVLPLTGDFTRCSQLADIGRDSTPVRIEDGKEVCKVRQSPAVGGVIPTEPGWYYDNFSSDVMMSCGAMGQRISFTVGAEPKSGARVRLECLQPVQNIGTGADGIGRACPAAPVTCASFFPGETVATPVCDTGTNTCQLQCASDAQCPSSFRCEMETGYCRNPTCGG